MTHEDVRGYPQLVVNRNTKQKIVWNLNDKVYMYYLIYKTLPDSEYRYENGMKSENHVIEQNRVHPIRVFMMIRLLQK